LHLKEHSSELVAFSSSAKQENTLQYKLVSRITKANPAHDTVSKGAGIPDISPANLQSTTPASNQMQNEQRRGAA
jgi:hypothetical protein